MGIVWSFFLQQCNVLLLPDFTVTQVCFSDLLWPWKKSDMFYGASLDSFKSLFQMRILFTKCTGNTFLFFAH